MNSFRTLSSAGLLAAWLAAPAAYGDAMLTTLVTFANTNGARPLAALVQASNGNFYGTTFFGGTSNLGTLFMMTPSGALTTLISFVGTNGSEPAAAMILSTNGNLYGTTSQGGTTNSDGTVYKVTPSSQFTTLVSPPPRVSSFPFSEPLEASNGIFYLTSQAGGANPNTMGTVYSMTPAGVVSNLAAMSNMGGNTPMGGLAQGRDGNFYGTTEYGGSSNFGTIFKITPTGALTPLISFTNGANPYAGLTLTDDGAFYGTTYNGGAHDKGTVFRLDTNGNVLTTLISFHGMLAPYGANPQGRLLKGNDGYLYGTTVNGGTNGGFGTVFQFSTNGTLTTLYNFGGFMDGAQPESGLIQGADGALYGTTYYGGTNSYGTVFRLDIPPVTPPMFQSVSKSGGSIVFT